ncbi:MAG: GNAT family N-acetyltransferase [Rubrivivax sp.]
MTVSPETPARFRWLPIRALGPRHRSRIAAHLLQLSADDRYLRFGYPASDEHIGRYVDQIDFDHDEVFGVFNRRLELVAVAHVAYLGGDQPGSAEFGVSVLPSGRGRGMGSRLFERACLHARNRGIDHLIVHALSENTAMLKIARHAGATLGREGADATAVLKLPPEDFGSHWSQLVETQAGEIDYGLKLQAARLDRLVQQVRDFMPGGGPTAGD